MKLILDCCTKLPLKESSFCSKYVWLEVMIELHWFKCREVKLLSPFTGDSTLTHTHTHTHTQQVLELLTLHFSPLHMQSTLKNICLVFLFSQFLIFLGFLYPI